MRAMFSEFVQYTTKGPIELDASLVIFVELALLKESDEKVCLAEIKYPFFKSRVLLGERQIQII
jgi:hypothetical protein